MRDAKRAVIGIRLRNDRGQTWAVTGSKQGLFMPDSDPGTTLIVEGPTDAAAAVDLGFDVIGRPACLGCDEMIRTKVEGYPGAPFIAADADTPGQRGAFEIRFV